MKRRIRTHLHRLGFTVPLWLMGCTPVQQQKAQSVANKAGLALTKAEVICQTVDQLLFAFPDDKSLPELKRLCDAGATAEEVMGSACVGMGYEKAD